MASGHVLLDGGQEWHEGLMETSTASLLPAPRAQGPPGQRCHSWLKDPLESLLLGSQDLEGQCQDLACTLHVQGSPQVQGSL